MIFKEPLVSEATAALAKASPPAAVVAISWGGLTLQDWTYVATIAYVVLQSAFLVWNWVAKWRAAKVPA